MEQSRGKKSNKILRKFRESEAWKEWMYLTKFWYGGNWVLVFLILGFLVFGVIAGIKCCQDSNWAANESNREFKVGDFVPNYSSVEGLNIDNFNFNVLCDRRTFTMRIKTDPGSLNIEFLAICPVDIVRFVDSPKEHSLWVYTTEKGARAVREIEKDGTHHPHWITIIHVHGQDEAKNVPLAKEISRVEVRMPKKDIPKYIGIIDNGAESEQENTKVENKD